MSQTQTAVTEAVTEAAPAGVTIADEFRIAMKIRGQIKQLEDLQAAEIKPFKDALARQEAKLTQHLTDTGAQNLAVPGVGTFYKSLKESFTVEDPSEFRRHVIGTEAYDLLDLKVNKTAARAFVDEHGGELPPGVKYSSYVTVGMRAK